MSVVVLLKLVPSISRPWGNFLTLSFFFFQASSDLLFCQLGSAFLPFFLFRAARIYQGSFASHPPFSLYLKIHFHFTSPISLLERPPQPPTPSFRINPLLDGVHPRCTTGFETSCICKEILDSRSPWIMRCLQPNFFQDSICFQSVDPVFRASIRWRWIKKYSISWSIPLSFFSIFSMPSVERGVAGCGRVRSGYGEHTE